MCENSLENPKEQENKEKKKKRKEKEEIEIIIEINEEEEENKEKNIIKNIQNDKGKRRKRQEKSQEEHKQEIEGIEIEEEEELFECPHCTFKNKKSSKECVVCSGSLKRKRIVSTNEDNDFEDIQIPQISASITTDLIPLIHNALEEENLREYRNRNEDSSNQYSYRLCSIACPHVSQKGVPMGGEWSCGYRNIQMLCHTLMSLPSYRRILFNGTGEVPDVHGLQAWIEKAWSNGFDVEGCHQLGGSLLGTTTWIGPTECVALLRYMGVRCQVVDFCGLKSSMSSMSKATKSSKTEKSTKSSKSGPKKRSGQIPNQSKITSFFDISGDEMTSVESVSTSPEPSLDMYHPLIQWVQIYFQTGHPRSVWDNEQSSRSTSSSSTTTTTSSSSSSQLSDSSEFIPPLYFQQDGHSRTLVGYEIKSTGKCSLFIFDPNHHGTTFKTKLNEGKGWQMMLKRGGHTLKRNEYQIVYVLPGLVDRNSKEYHDSKIITSESVIT